MHLAMYYRYKYKAELSVLFHVTTTKVDGLKLTDPLALSTFADLADELNFMRQRFFQAKKFDWEVFRLLAASVTETESEGIREKFSPELYLERQRLRKTFDHFLNSDKTIFVLLGASGVGKSNFLLALANDLEHSDNLAFIFLNAAKIPAGTKIKDEITSLFTQRFRIASSQRSDPPFKDLFALP